MSTGDLTILGYACYAERFMPSMVVARIIDRLDAR